MAQSATLLVFCKQPRLDQGKSRIAASLGAEKTLAIAQGLLNCALEDAAAWPGPVVLSPAAESEVVWAESLLPEHNSLTVIAQPSGNLGERINALDQHLRAQGQANIVTIGTDAPILGEPIYQQVIAQLEQVDIVCSKASDGGVTIMAASAPWPNLERLPWSTDTLAAALEQCCEQAGLSLGYVEPTYDIDFETDLVKLAEDLKNDQRPARQALLQLITSILNR